MDRRFRAVVIVITTWLAGSVVLSILGGSILRIETASGSVGLAGIGAFVAGVALAWWDARRRGAPPGTPPSEVTFARQPEPSLPAASERPAEAPTHSDADAKVCPDCSETVQAAARICRYCRHTFAPPASAVATSSDQFHRARTLPTRYVVVATAVVAVGLGLVIAVDPAGLRNPCRDLGFRCEVDPERRIVAIEDDPCPNRWSFKFYYDSPVYDPDAPTKEFPPIRLSDWITPCSFPLSDDGTALYGGGGKIVLYPESLPGRQDGSP